MTEDTPETPPDPGSAAAAAVKSGNRIAKVLARAGLASRRDAEKLIAAGRVAVNGRVIDSPALDIGPKDRVTLDGQPIPDAEPPRLWLYHKPAGLVTTEKDEEGRATVFDNLPDDLPRVMSVGRLDITSEGLLLLTNDGEIKRRLELPSTGWLRKYRVRVNGTPHDASLAPLRQGITVDGVAYQPMQVTLDRQQGANAWLTVGLREGKNREVRRAMEAVGLTVNRLIRVSYGPFRLEEIEPGQVVEVRPKVLRDQLGLSAPEAGGSARTVRTVRGSGTRSAPAAKGAFAAREGKAGWLANPSSSGRARTGSKTGGSARSLDAAPAGAGGDGSRGSKGTGSKGNPRAAGTRFAAPVGKGKPARPRPAWGDRQAETEGDGTADVRTRKPRSPRSSEGAAATSEGGGSARPVRTPRQGSGKTWGERKPSDRKASGHGDRAGQDTAGTGPGGRETGKGRGPGPGRFASSGGPGKAPRASGVARPPRSAEGASPGRSAGQGPRGGGPARSKGGASGPPKAGSRPAGGGARPRGPGAADRSEPSGPPRAGNPAVQGTPTSSSRAFGPGGKPARSSGSGPKDGGPRTAGSRGPGSRTPGSRAPGSRGDGSEVGGPKGDGPRGPRTKGPKPRGPKPR